ncbi:MAG: class I SAM-dependent methyltransferase, partial [Eudoraea sp.]|nr:class I SAM-dependent methyltransferase [Eudoraea sp.]
KKSPFPLVSSQELAQQISSRKKCEKKLPSWFQTPGIYYPESLAIEQASSERTARYKANLVSGKTLADLTGGMGVDSYYFSQRIDKVSYFEINPSLAEISTHNFQILGVKNIEVNHQDGMSFLEESKREFDWIYLDPARRGKQKQRVFRLQDGKPDVIKNLQLLLDNAGKILLKTAPMLDIQQGLKDLRHQVSQIHVVSVRNEVKELLWILDKMWDKEPEIITINMTQGEDQVFSFRASMEKEANSSFSNPLQFLYEPNAAILKAGAFKLVGERYGLQKLNPNSHLFTSEELIDFPGRKFRIQGVYPYSKKLPFSKANVATRNFPLKADALSKKHRIITGGDDYLFFTKNKEDKLLVVACTKA